MGTVRHGGALPRGAPPRGSSPLPARTREVAVSPAIEPALVDLHRALCRDRSHVIVAAPPGAEQALLLRALPGRLEASVHAVPVSLDAVREDEICGCILRALGREPGADAEGRLLGLAEDLAGRGSALVLLVGDAASLAPETLRRVGRLAAASRAGLRLALFVTSAEDPDGETIGRVVRSVGLGAQKVALDTGTGVTPVRRLRKEPAGRTEDARQPPTLEPPASPAADKEQTLAARVPEGTGQGSPPRERLRRGPPSRHGRTAVLAAGIALLAVLGLAVGTASIERVPSAQPLARPGEAVPAAGSAPVALAPPGRSPITARSAASPNPPPPEVGAEDAGSPRPHAPAEPTPPAPVASARPAPTVAVSLNARPWARIEVDGRKLGVTPLADVRLSPGAHRFRAHFPDGRVVERTVEVDAHRDRVTFP